MKSIRLQLPLTYAAIALLTALALGALMLLRLNDYYSQRELDTMSQNAKAIQMALQPLDLAAMPAAELQANVDSFAFMARSRVRIYTPGGALLADSGEFDAQDSAMRFATLPFAAAAQGDVIFFQGAAGGQMQVEPSGVSGSVIGTGPSASEVTPEAGVSLNASRPAVVYMTTQGQSSTLPVFTSFVASGPVSLEEENGERSLHAVELPLGSSAAKLVVSGGPAFGRQIVASVAQAWALAGLLAVALAGVTGWWVSQRITRPVLQLALATDRMAAGELSARVGELSGREFGALGRAFNQMAGRVESTIQALRRFAADAAHELKTPLTALHTDLELAEGEHDPARLAGLLQRARAQVGQLDRLTSGLLDLSRLETGTLEMAMDRLDVSALARQLCERYAARAEQAGQEFDLDLPDGPVYINGSPARLELALGNLLENALKFTPAGGQVRLVLAQAEPGRRVVLAVEDSGMGVPQADLPLVFERFHRGRNAAGYPGSGLGLAIVRAVAEAHGGTAAVENLTAGGARFSIQLPSAQE
jgi:signal transduction histidine kinase